MVGNVRDVGAVLFAAGNKSKASRMKRGAKGGGVGRGARGEIPTPRSGHDKGEVSITRAYTPTHTHTDASAHLSIQEGQEPPLTKRAEADAEIEKTYQLTGHSAAEGVATLWEKDAEQNENEYEEAEGEHYVPNLPV